MLRDRLLRTVVLAMALSGHGERASARTLNAMPNPSPGLGIAAPSAWALSGSAAVTRTPARGTGSIEARTSRPERVATSQPVGAVADQSYRLSGWIRCRKGRARLGLDVLDGRGKVLDTAATPWVTAGSARVYTAAERDIAVPDARQGSRVKGRGSRVEGQGSRVVRLWFEVDGQAQLDDVVLAPMIANLLYNASFEPDSRGRVGMWVEEPTELLPGTRAGSQGADVAGRQSGGALQLKADAGAWWGSRGIAAALPAGLTRFRFTGWSRAEGGAAEARVLWLDAEDRVLRADVIPPREREGAWQRHEDMVRAPEGATQVTASAVAHGGKAWFDDFSLTAVAPAREKRRVAQALVNQVGYETAGPKSAVVATNFFPADTARGWLEIVSEAGTRVLRVPLSAARIHDGESADWGSYYWRGDFSAVRRPGQYRAVARVGGVRAESFPFRVGERVVLRETGKLGVEFFFVQRCGFEVPGWHKACHLDDARLPNGTAIDATGGWHSAGDYNKIMYENGDGGVAYALLKAYDALPDLFRRHDRDGDGRPDILDEALWGARFVAKMQDPRTGGLYKDIRQGPGRNWTKWSAPEVHTDNVAGTPDDPVIDAGEGSSPLVPAVWARLGNMLAEQGEQSDFGERARRYWSFLMARDGALGSPHLLLAALELHAITGERGYLDYARRTAETLLSQQVRDGRFRGAWGTSGELTAGALAAFALARPDDALSEKIRGALAEFRAFLESTAENPFGLSQQSVGEKEYFFEPTSTLGMNFQQLQKAWAAALIYRLNGDERALRFCTDQIDWVLGKNPYNLCQMEGAGTLNPPRYHHRYNMIPGRERGAVPGAIPNGFVRSIAGEDQPGFDISRPAPGKRPPSYRTSEPWLVHNMWYLMALAALPG